MENFLFDDSQGAPILKSSEYAIKIDPDDRAFMFLKTNRRAISKSSYKLVKTFVSFENLLKENNLDIDLEQIIMFINPPKKYFSGAVLNSLNFGIYNIFKEIKFPENIIKQIQKYGIYSKQTKALIKLYKD